MLSSTTPTTIPLRLELKEYRLGVCTIRVWKREGNYASFAPWSYAIQKDGESERTFGGIPNLCESRHTAYMRGYHRAKWINEGTWHKHYK